MDWFAVYEQDSGRLVSVGTVVAEPLPKGLATAKYPQPPADTQMWDAHARAFVPRPPKQLLSPDGDPELTELKDTITRLSPSQREAVRRMLQSG